MARYDDLNTNMIAYAAVLSCFLLIAILQGTQALCYNMTNAAQDDKLAKSEYTSSTEVIREQLNSINGYKRVKETPPMGADGKPTSAEPKTRIQVPIDRAIELILTEKKAAAKNPSPPGA
jgi:hypothetical protein